MVYMNNFIVVVKHNGKVLREREGFVELPFGAEYEILLKNKNSVKAVANVEIDGQDVLDNHQIVLNPNSSTTLKGFMNGMNVRNRFKFIQKTKEIANYRGDREDDGMIRVEFRFEKKYQNVTPCVKSFIPNSGTWYYDHGNSAGVWGGCKSVCDTYTCSNSIMSVQYGSTPVFDEGITVKGSEVNQGFVYGYTNELETYSDVIILRLKGFKESGKLVNKPILVKSRLTCTICGCKSRSNSKFCYNCGAYLR